jgi:hypothetical protein
VDELSDATGGRDDLPGARGAGGVDVAWAVGPENPGAAPFREFETASRIAAQK